MFYDYIRHLENKVIDASAYEILRREKHQALFNFFKIKRYRIGKKRSKSYQINEYIIKIVSKTIGFKDYYPNTKIRKLENKLKYVMKKCNLKKY